MTPDNPQDPSTGKADEVAGKQAEEAAETKAAAAAEQAEEPKAPKKPSRAKKTASADKPAAADQPAAESGEAAKPRRRRKAAEPEAEGQAAAETGVDKTAAAATGPRRRHRQKTDPSVLVRAQARYVRTSARKARLVCDHIRGKDVAEARAILAFTPRAAAKPWLKLLESAVANAEHNHELVGEELRIAAVHADEGPTLKRFRPRAMGRATRIRKRTSHLTITLTPKES
jgi:ribosomal protein L22